ncbi:MAG: hypothetical protein IPK60_03515 [Sandaracinaceae bacterium]|nr:hypothetical protein [Sandaracinaceae bacterium]
MRTRQSLLSVASIALLLAGCANSDPPAGVDAGRGDAGRDAGRDAGPGTDLGVDLGVDAGPRDLGIDMNATGAEGDTCGNAVAISEGVTTLQSTVGFSNNYQDGTSCTATAGLDRVYSITVPAGKRLSVLVESDDATDMSVSLIELAHCADASRTCLASNDHGAVGQADLVIYDNATTDAVAIAIVVDSYLSTDLGGSYTVSASIVTAPTAGETCGAPTVIAGTGGTMGPETIVGFRNDYRSTATCTSLAGADHVYSITVDAGLTLTASVSPFGVWDPSLNVIVGTASACMAEPVVCAASADTGEPGETDSINYTNTSGEAQNVFIIVDSFDSTQGTYTLTTSVHAT